MRGRVSSGRGLRSLVMVPKMAMEQTVMVVVGGSKLSPIHALVGVLI